MTYKTYIALAIALFFPSMVFSASPVQITPAIIDEQASPKEMLKYDIKIRNSENQKYDFFVFVHDFSPEHGINKASTSVDTDRRVSPASWTSIRRSFDLDPYAEIVLPLEINVAPDAIPGKYFEAITFAVGSNAAEAESQVGNGAAELRIGLDIEERKVEKMQILEFKPERNLFFSYPVNLNVNLKNVGNVSLEPRGVIYFYERSGQEIDKVEVPSFSIAGGESKQMVLNWDTKDRLGKYKARLEMEYGSGIKRDLQDNIYFWIFPIRFLIYTGVALFLLVFFLVYVMFKKTYHGGRESHHEDDGSGDGTVLDLR